MTAIQSKSRTFVVYAGSYNEDSGGNIALHKLCHILNSIGHTSYIFPEILSGGELATLGNHDGANLFDRYVASNFKTNPEFKCPILSATSLSELHRSTDIITVYPEVIDGNPLGAKNVVRWLLHNLGFHTGRINISKGDLLIPYDSSIEAVSIPGCRFSSSPMRIVHIPFEKYNTQDEAITREGVAFCVRKGKGKAFVHPQEGAVLIDGRGHDEISALFKRVKSFYSYDTGTLYSRLAVLCGCESIVVPDPGIPLEGWVSDPRLRIGVHYGQNGGRPSPETIRELITELQETDLASVENVRIVAGEIFRYFDSR